MLIVEMPRSSPVNSVSICTTGHQSLYCCLRGRDGVHQQFIKWCAIFKLNLKIRTTSSQCFGSSVVTLGEGSGKWLRSAKWRIPDVGLSSKCVEIDSSCFSPCKVAKGRGFEPVFKEDKVLILPQNGDLAEVSAHHMLSTWGSLADEVADPPPPQIGDISMVPGKTRDAGDDKIHYLEVKNEKKLSERIIKLSRSNKVRSVLALYRSMAFCGLLPNLHACNSLLSCLLRNDRLHDALKIFKFMKAKETVSGHSYSLILKAIASYRSCDAALIMFEEAEREQDTNKYLDAVVYNTMIAAFGKGNNWVQAERMWRTLQKNGHVGTVVTYRLLICIFVRSGQNELALDAYNEMVQNGLSPCKDSLEAIIGACVREGKWEMGLSVFQSVMKNGRKPSLTSCNALINSLGKAGRVELAFKVYGLMESFGHVPDAYSWNALLGALYSSNQHADALCLFESIRKEHKSVLNLHIYNTGLMCCQRLGLWDKAVQLLWQMETNGLPVSVMSYNLVIASCEGARKPDIALQVYEHMVQRTISPDTFTFLSLIRSFIWGSRWSEVEEILNSRPDGSLYNTAIQGMCLRNQSDMARKLYMQMRKIGLKPDGKTRALMLQNLT
ncbi:pentatricopeptide repeat-containing protein [Dorcoceras hygrometricum]|uniref:Pentatricopeptide repeat-containing protein n=1 Tax=Dorcoceras hygrometricum TaxID=472368 RepID=A0A2Z7CFT9_9LAMI|nr:pentatricopeptide repeat-containing protein [Dorcoceras hygrometricum]